MWKRVDSSAVWKDAVVLYLSHIRKHMKLSLLQFGSSCKTRAGWRKDIGTWPNWKYFMYSTCPKLLFLGCLSSLERVKREKKKMFLRIHICLMYVQVYVLNSRFQSCWFTAAPFMSLWSLDVPAVSLGPASWRGEPTVRYKIVQSSQELLTLFKRTDRNIG